MDLQPIIADERRRIADLLEGLDADRATERMTAAWAHRSIASIVASLRAHADRRFDPPIVGLYGPLTDLVVHGLDIRRPVGIARSLPEDRLRPVLAFVTGPRARGVVKPSWLPARQVRFADATQVRRGLDAFRLGRGDFPDYLIREAALAAQCTQVLTFDAALLGEAGFASPDAPADPGSFGRLRRR